MSGGWQIAELAADTFAVVMMLVMLCSFAVIGLLFWYMRRIVARRDRYVDALLDELQEAPRETVVESQNRKFPQQTSEPWKRDDDWWKRF